MAESIVITKASGEKESFDSRKLVGSLQNAGADKSTVQQILSDIESRIKNGSTTKDIYQRAFSMLRQKNRFNAARYTLKQALYDLGDTGYPFEHLMGEIFKRQGYQTQVGQVLQGRCITHEMDVIATRENEQVLVECKYSQHPGKLVSIQVPLYVHSRIEDIVAKRREEPTYQNFNFGECVATNTRFSFDCMEYARCIGMKLIAWDYPNQNGLKDLIERDGIFPVPVLTQLSKSDKTKLLEKGIVTCQQIADDSSALDELTLTARKKRDLLFEIDDLCSFKGMY
jgi:hypothetical protein